MRKSLLITTSLASAVLFSGCATIMSGDSQNINVTSYPSHQEVTVGYQKVITPSIVTVKRSNNDLIVRCDSKKSNNQKIIKSKINPWFLGNIILLPIGGLFSSTTDAAKGSMWKYDDNVNLNCQKK